MGNCLNVFLLFFKRTLVMYTQRSRIQNGHEPLWKIDDKLTVVLMSIKWLNKIEWPLDQDSTKWANQSYANQKTIWTHVYVEKTCFVGKFQQNRVFSTSFLNEPFIAKGAVH